MSDGGADGFGRRVLVLAPTARDAATSCAVLAAAGVTCHPCGTIDEVCREAARGAGAAVVTAEAVVADAAGRLAALVRAQPPWSDLPLVVLTPPGDESPRLLRALEAVGPMTLVRRPVQVSTLVSTVRAALRDRERQYAVRDLLAERERAAERLTAERERYRVTLSSIGDAVIATDTAGRVTFLNPAAEGLTRWAAGDAHGRPLGDVFRIINEATRAAVENPALRALREGVVVGLANHTVLVARDGTERPIDDSAAPIRTGGEVSGAVLVFRDISDRHEAAAKLRASEERHRTVLESITEGFFAVDAGWRFTYANARAERTLGREPGDLLGRVLWDVYPGMTGSELERLYRRVAADRTAEAATVYYPDHDRWYEAHAYPAGDGLSVFFADVTAQHRAEEHVRRAAEANAKFRAMFEQGTQFAGILTPDGTVVEANRRCLDACGFTRDEVVGKPFWECGWWNRSPALVELVRAACAGAAAARPFRAETNYFVADGGERFVDLTVAPVTDDGGRILFLAAAGTDITERKRAEDARRRSEERYRVLVNSTSDVVYRMSADWEVMHPLDGRGLVPSTAAPLRDWMRLNIPPSDHARLREAIDRAVAGKTTFELEHRVTRADGTPGWTFSRAVPILDAAGGIVEWFGTARDVTDQKHARDELVRVTAEGDRVRRLYETVLSATPDFIYVFSLDHRVLYANDSLLEMWGRGRDGAVGKTFLEIGYEPWHAAMHDREIDTVRATKKPIRGEVPFDGAHGRRIYDYIFVPVLGAGGEVEAVAGTTRDVTDRKAAEEAVRRGEERLQLAVGIARMGTFEIDLPTDAVTVNEPGRDIYGWPDVRTTFARVQTFFHPADRDDVMRQVGAALDPAGPGVFEVEQRIVRADGAVRWLRVRGRALFDGAGPARRAVLCVGAFLDVTDRKETEEALREADRRKDDFIALLAHELRNPLAPIRNGLQVIRLSHDRAVRDRSQRMMDRQLAHMVRLIDDLLDVSRIGRNKMELRLARVALADVVGSAVETAGPAVEEGAHELAVSLPPHPVYLDADLTRLAQVVSNLLTNSAKYTERGGKIWLTAEAAGGRVVVSVRDTGIGIPAAALPTIFDMFSQVDRPTERSSGGLGIGLALVKGLVEMHGGTVTARSDGQGRGSEFTVTLPAAADQPAAAPAAPDAATPAPRPKRRILVVDDNRDGADSLAMMLELIGNDIRTAHDGLEAVARAEEFRPDIVLMDVGMPKLNGLEATKRIRGQAWGRAMTVIALTGWGQDADRERTREAGCDGHLVKPVNLPDLEDLLDRLRAARSA